MTTREGGREWRGAVGVRIRGGGGKTRDGVSHRCTDLDDLVELRLCELPVPALGFGEDAEPLEAAAVLGAVGWHGRRLEHKLEAAADIGAGSVIGDARWRWAYWAAHA